MFFKQLFNELKILNMEKQRILTTAGLLWKVAYKEVLKTIGGHLKPKKKNFRDKNYKIPQMANGYC